MFAGVFGIGGVTAAAIPELSGSLGYKIWLTPEIVAEDTNGTDLANRHVIYVSEALEMYISSA